MEPLFNKVVSLQAWKRPTQVFSCEICEIIKNTYFEEQWRMIASEIEQFA